jgi:hypothetical protein
MARFAQRPPLPARPSRAFVFSNRLQPKHLQLIIEECGRRGMTLDVLGSEPIDNPETVLCNYDVVFARGRCALESMAVGAALIVCGREGMGPMATTHNFDELRALNFGMRALHAPVTRENVVRVLETYDAADAMAVSWRVRNQASLTDAVTDMLRIYTEVIHEHRGAVYDRRREDLAIARFVYETATRARIRKLRDQQIRSKLEQLQAANQELKSKLQQLQATNQRLKLKLKSTGERPFLSYLKKFTSFGTPKS